MSEQSEIVRPQDLADYICRIASGMGPMVECLIERVGSALNEAEQVRIDNEERRQEAAGRIVEALEYINNLATGEASGVSSFLYPVGAVYISFEKTSPSVLFGGTWEAIDEGRFLMASKKASGNTGGNKNHLHEMWMAAANMNVDSSGNLNYQELYAYDKNETFMSYTYNKSVPINTYAYESQGEEFFGVRVIGTTDRSDHTPPYVTVYMWRRIA